MNTVNSKSYSFKLGHNKFSTWTEAERNRLFSGPMKTSEPSGEAKDGSASNSAPIDWRDSKAVSAVKDQGTCGADWAFSTTGVMEGAH